MAALAGIHLCCASQKDAQPVLYYSSSSTPSILSNHSNFIIHSDWVRFRSGMATLVRRLGHDPDPAFLRSFSEFAATRAQASHFPWHTWVVDCSHRPRSSLELKIISEAESLAMQYNSPFSAHLRENYIRMRLTPVHSGWKLVSLLYLLAEDADQVMAAEVYLILRNGYDLVPAATPDVDIPRHKFANYPDALRRPDIIDLELARLLDKGYVAKWEVIRAECGRPELSEPYYIMPINLLSKLNPDGTDKHRLIFDPSRPDGESLNDFCSEDIFTRYINIWMAITAMAVGGAAWRADFEDAYFQLPLSMRSRFLVGFRWRGVTFGFRRGAFGFRPLPWLQQTVTIALVRAVVRRMVSAGLRSGQPPEYQHKYSVRKPQRGHEHTTMLPLLDDVGGFASTKTAATFGFIAYLWVCFFAGCRCSQKPGKTVPPSTEDMVFIGYLLRFSDMTISMEPERIQNMTVRLQSVLDKGVLFRSDLESIIGVLVFITTVVGMRTYYRSFIELLKRNRHNKRIIICAGVQQDIRKWFDLMRLFNGQTVFRGVRRARAAYPLYTDASFSGWGFAWHTSVIPGAWPSEWHGRFGHVPQKSKHEYKGSHRIWIHTCELLAVLMALRVVLPWAGNNKVLKLFCDNSAVCGMLSKLQTSSIECRPVLTEILWLLGAFQGELDVHWIDTKSNVTADAASRIFSGAISSGSYLQIVRAFRAGKPYDMADAGLVKSRPARPELLRLMDVWQPEPGVDVSVFPRALNKGYTALKRAE